MDQTANKYTIGLLGGGFVGKILKKFYPHALMYDTNDKFDKLEDVLKQEIIFIAFNLTDNGIESYSEVEDYANIAPEDRIFVIKSTFVPGTTDRLQTDFPQHRFIYNPEFLTEMTAWNDFTHPVFQILGVPQESHKLVREVFSILPQAPVMRVISPKDAEILKHAINSYYATKVIFFNQLSDMCGQLEGDYDTVREIMVQDPRIGDSHSMIHHNGYRGFGGKCLPKDIEAFSKVAKSELLNLVQKINANYLQSK